MGKLITYGECEQSVPKTLLLHQGERVMAACMWTCMGCSEMLRACCSLLCVQCCYFTKVFRKLCLRGMRFVLCSQSFAHRL